MRRGEAGDVRGVIAEREDGRRWLGWRIGEVKGLVGGLARTYLGEGTWERGRGLRPVQAGHLG